MPVYANIHDELRVPAYLIAAKMIYHFSTFPSFLRGLNQQQAARRSIEIFTQFDNPCGD